MRRVAGRPKPTSACAPWPCAGRAPCGPLSFPCGHGSRAAACGRAAMVGRCASKPLSRLAPCRAQGSRKPRFRRLIGAALAQVKSGCCIPCLNCLRPSPAVVGAGQSRIIMSRRHHGHFCLSTPWQWSRPRYRPAAICPPIPPCQDGSGRPRVLPVCTRSGSVSNAGWLGRAAWTCGEGG